MDQLEIFIALFAIIASVGVLFRNSTAPVSLILVIVGMLLSFVPGFPPVMIHHNFVLDIFLPLLLYEASAYTSSWKEIQLHLRPIALLSIGHVIFITFLVATAIHWLLPDLGWPLAIVIGAIISPPDDVAIMAIAEKIRMPSRVVSILKGEAMLNDATAIIIYKFALIAFITHQFSLLDSVGQFFFIVISQTIYGFVLATLIGELRLRVKDSSLQMMISILTPFIAYLPAEKLMGSGVVATVATGLFIGNFYWSRYSPDVRLAARTVWTTLAFGVQSILFLLVGLDFKYVISQTSGMSTTQLLLYSIAIVMVVIVGRFIWCFPSAYIPRWLFASIRNNEPPLPWQYPFIISWAGMRGGVSLALALAVPALPIINGLNPKDILIYFVFVVIIATLLIQGLSLPWVLKLIGAPIYGKKEEIEEQRTILATRAAMIAAALKWLSEYQVQTKDDATLSEEIKIRLDEYTLAEKKLQERLKTDDPGADETDINADKKSYLVSKIIDVERNELNKFWHNNKIDLAIRYKLEQELDLRDKRLQDMA